MLIYSLLRSTLISLSTPISSCLGYSWCCLAFGYASFNEVIDPTIRQCKSAWISSWVWIFGSCLRTYSMVSAINARTTKILSVVHRDVFSTAFNINNIQIPNHFLLSLCAGACSNHYSSQGWGGRDKGSNPVWIKYRIFRIGLFAHSRLGRGECTQTDSTQ